MRRFRTLIALVMAGLFILPAYANQSPRWAVKTQTLAAFQGAPLFDVDGHLMAYREETDKGDLIVVKDLTTNQPILTLFTHAIVLDIALDETSVAWIDDWSGMVHLVALASGNHQQFPLPEQGIKVGIDLTRQSVVLRTITDSSGGPPHYGTLWLFDRSTGARTQFETSVVALDADGDWIVFLQVDNSGRPALMAYALTTKTRWLIDHPTSLYAGNFSLDATNARLAYALDHHTPVQLYDLATQQVIASPSPLRAGDHRIMLRGDLLGISSHDFERRIMHLSLHHSSTGLQHTMAWHAGSTSNWQLTHTPDPTIVWSDFYLTEDRGRVIGYLRATTFSAAAVPDAMNPEVPSMIPGSQFFATTQHNVSPPMINYWSTNGGLPQFGYPLSAQFDELNADTNQDYPTQYFERQRFEWHREHAGTPYEILLGRLGDEALLSQGRDWRNEGHDTLVPTQLPGECSTFEPTQRTVCGPFLSYWRSHGLDFGHKGISYDESLALFGLPLTAPRYELNADGDYVITQWFERARFEYHPNNLPPYDVLLGRLGAEVLTGRGWHP